MTISVIVPFNDDGAERARNWSFLRARYEALYDWEIVEGSCEGQWCKSTAVSEALETCSGDLLVISDADMFLADEVMREGVARLQDCPWVVPHHRAYRLSEAATLDFIAGALDPSEITHDHLEMPTRRMFPCGGLFFIRRETYLSVGGFDRRFLGWGGEDESLGMALKTLVGEPLLLGAVLLHLYHEPQPTMPADRLRPPRVDPLVKRYEAAQGDPIAMRALIQEVA
jgi:hypothetical protein